MAENSNSDDSGGEMTLEVFPGEWSGREVRVVVGRVAEQSERGGRTRLGKGWNGSLPDAVYRLSEGMQHPKVWSAADAPGERSEGVAPRRFSNSLQLEAGDQHLHHPALLEHLLVDQYQHLLLQLLHPQRIF